MDLGSRVPFLMTKVCQAATDWPASHYVRERCEGVLHNECMDLMAIQHCAGKCEIYHWELKITFDGLRLARSIATAPPNEWPYRICGRHVRSMFTFTELVSYDWDLGEDKM